MSIAEIEKKRRRTLPKVTVPDYLIRETMDGVPFYYHGYEQVLMGKKQLEEIMGASSLQSFIVSFIFRQLVRFLDEKKYHLLVSEPGLHIDRRNNLSGDIMIYERNVLTPSKITVKYADVPALIDVEVDVKVDLSRKKDFDYVMRKTQKLLDFGTQKVVWIFTETQKVMVAQVNEPWLTYDWSRDIALLDGVTFNIGQYLADEGVETKTEA